MDIDNIDYYFDSIDSFYAELDDMLKRPCCNEQQAQDLITEYIRFLTKYNQEFLTSHQELAKVSYKLIDSTLFLNHSTSLLGHILHAHALNASAPPLIAYSLLYYAGKDEPTWSEFILFQSIKAKRNLLFGKMIGEIREGGFEDVKVLGVSFSLLFEMCKLFKLSEQDQELLDAPLFHYFLDLVEATRGDADESFNYNVIRFITVLNEQFLMSNSDNLLTRALLERRADTFCANLIFMLNRSSSDEACIQLLILKSLYCIFTRHGLYEYFYTNDLYVLLDIILRELCNLGDTKEAQTLREAYLRVLEPLLENTQLQEQPYKQDEIYRTLNQLINPVMKRRVRTTTKRIVGRIIETNDYLSDSSSSSSSPTTPDSLRPLASSTICK
ncbi:hypothetical protein K501DRAFT_324693 [Backusella circina FSU 941]|nr:hypothetical protein K501DRAFT_324693 [Backusella circina FSU 941]